MKAPRLMKLQPIMTGGLPALCRLSRPGELMGQIVQNVDSSSYVKNCAATLHCVTLLERPLICPQTVQDPSTAVVFCSKCRAIMFCVQAL